MSTGCHLQPNVLAVFPFLAATWIENETLNHMHAVFIARLAPPPPPTRFQVKQLTSSFENIAGSNSVQCRNMKTAGSNYEVSV